MSRNWVDGKEREFDNGAVEIGNGIRVWAGRILTADDADSIDPHAKARRHEENKYYDAIYTIYRISIGFTQR